MHTLAPRACASAPGGFQVELVDRDQVWPPRQLGGELLDLAADRGEVLPRIGGAAVDEINQDLRALDVTKETQAKPGAMRRAFDQSRDIRDHNAPALGLRDPKLRIERRERVRGDFRARGGE